MDPRAAELISTLEMSLHPEGGYFREVYRSTQRVQPLNGPSERDALTTIYFLLPAGAVSRWHRVGSDEVWHFYEGDPLELLTADRDFARISTHVLGRVDDAMRPVHVVPPNEWQAARSMGAYSLAGCTVGPGFEFADFEMLRECPIELEAARRQHPETTPFI